MFVITGVCYKKSHVITNLWENDKSKLKLLTLLNNRRRFFRFVLIFKILNNLDCPEQVLGIFKFRRSVRSREPRDETLLDLPKVKTRMGQTMFAYMLEQRTGILYLYIFGSLALSPSLNKYFLNTF